MISKKTMQTLIAGAAAMTMAGSATSADAMGNSEGQEKCYGVVKAGHNLCASLDNTHGCAGAATEDGSPNEWIYVPEGLCEKLVGGTLHTEAREGEDHPYETHHEEKHDG